MIILLAMFFVLLGGCIKNEYIVIGAVLPLTGEAGEFGQYAKQGIDLAVKNINLSGGINGKQIKVIYEDDELMPKKSALAFQKLITTDNVNYVIGFGSGETLAMCPLAEENKIILMSSGSSPEISNCGEFTFRNYPSDNFQGKVLAENIYALGVRNVFLTYSNTDYGKGLHNVFVKSFKDLGGTITVDESYAFGNNDYKIILSKIKNNTVDAVVFFPNSNQEIISFFNQKSEFGLNIPVYGSEVFYNKDILDTSEDYSDLYFVAISNYGGAEYNNFKSEYLNDYKFKSWAI
jgi:branched-chain amino acid transport system substrate-binding protein